MLHNNIKYLEKKIFIRFFKLQLIMELENNNAHGDTGPNTPLHENDPSGSKKWYRQASQRFVNAPFVIYIQSALCIYLYRSETRMQNSF